jgi:glycosyltransferase involved in cell wall biosynthesis
VKLKVFFGSALGYRKYKDINFGEEISWNNLNLDRFDHVFLNGYEVIQPDKNLDAASLEEELEKFAPDLLVSYGYFQKLQRRAKNWAIKNKVQVAYISDAEGRQHRSPLKEQLRAFMLRRYFRDIAYFLTVGDANEAYYRSYKVPGDKMLRMHFPIDVQQYQQYYEQREKLDAGIRQQYGIGHDEIVLCVVGKLVAWKNQDHIIQALALLEKKAFVAHLFILGSGKKLHDWEAAATTLKKSKVHFPGFVSIDDLPAYYAAADIYVHPASVEPHSIAISEAIYMGKPVILSDRCGSYGPTDDVEVGVNGLVFPFGDIPALASAIEQLIVDEGVRQNFSEGSHARAVSFQHIAHHGILEKLISSLIVKKQSDTFH